MFIVIKTRWYYASANETSFYPTSVEQKLKYPFYLHNSFYRKLPMKCSGKYAVFSFMFDLLDLILRYVACTCFSLALSTWFLFWKLVETDQFDLILSLFWRESRWEMRLSYWKGYDKTVKLLSNSSLTFMSEYLPAVMRKRPFKVHEWNNINAAVLKSLTFIKPTEWLFELCSLSYS